MENKIDEHYIHQLISANIKRLRILQNISQLNLAHSTGLTHNFINDIENCKKGISVRSLAKLSNALNVEPYQFFLPEGMLDDDIMLYARALNDSVQKAVAEVTQNYISRKKDTP
jgi:transcriptional regulator with XRE-family HTH domain